MLDKVTKGRVKRPHLVLIYSDGGVGKSTFASRAPVPIFLGTESGTDNLDVSRFPTPQKWSDVVTAIEELTIAKHDYQTLVIDSLDWAEPLLHQSICAAYGAKSMELAAGGYGKAYGEAATEWQKLLKSLSRLRDEKKMNIILIAHSQVVKFNDPQTQTEYDRHQIKLHKKSSALVSEFVDSVLFANFEIYAKKDGQKTQHYGDGVRVIHTERRPGFDAKTRFTMPATIPLSWDDYARAVEVGGDVDPDKIRASLIEMADGLQDASLKKTVIETIERAGRDADKLETIRSRLVIRLGE